MLRHVHWESTMFDSDDDERQTEKDLCWLLECLVQRNMDYLRQRPKTPRLYKSGVVYEAPKQFAGECEEVAILRQALGRSARKRDVARVLELVQAVLGGEHFCDIGVILERGAVDCFPLTQKIIVRSKSTGMYEVIALGDLRFAYPAYEALSYNFETRQQEFKSIIGFVDKGEKPVSKAHLSNGTDLVATDSHKFWSLDGSRQCHPYSDSFHVACRTMGEYVEAYQEREKHSKAWRERRSRIVQASRIPELSVTKPSPADLYLAGIYAAEGCGHDSVTEIGQYKPEVRQKIERVLQQVGVSYSYDEPRGKTPGSGARYRLLGGRSSEVVMMLRDLGTNSFNIQFPQSYLSSDQGSVRQLLDAHADGDGWRPKMGVVYKKSGLRGLSTEYTTSSDVLMEQIRLGLLIVGHPAYTYHQKDHQGAGSKPIWRVDEYNERASKLMGRARRMESLGFNDLTYATVRNAGPLGTAHVGCIEVEENHNFFLADGTLAANCDGLASWRCAELRQGGIKARPMMTCRKGLLGNSIYHALVLWPPHDDVPYETSEDPSLLLGMGGASRSADRQEEIRKNAERCDILRARGLSGVQTIDSALADVLRLDGRRGAGSALDMDAALASISGILSRGAA